MKILLDENIDVRLKRSFPEGWEVYTVRDMNWTGAKNGRLLPLLEQNSVDCWIVVDKNIPPPAKYHQPAVPNNCIECI